MQKLGWKLFDFVDAYAGFMNRNEHRLPSFLVSVLDWIGWRAEALSDHLLNTP